MIKVKGYLDDVCELTSFAAELAESMLFGYEPTLVICTLNIGAAAYKQSALQKPYWAKYSGVLALSACIAGSTDMIVDDLAITVLSVVDLYKTYKYEGEMH